MASPGKAMARAKTSLTEAASAASGSPDSLTSSGNTWRRTLRPGRYSYNSARAAAAILAPSASRWNDASVAILAPASSENNLAETKIGRPVEDENDHQATQSLAGLKRRYEI